MGIGTSLGAYFENDFNHQAGIEDHTHDEMVVSPGKVDQNKQLEKQDDEVLGGTEVSDKTKSGEYIGELGKDDDVSFDRTLPIGRRGDDGKVQYHIDPKDVPLQPGEESFTLPDNPHLWIRKSKELVPMSSNKNLVQPVAFKDRSQEPIDLNPMNDTENGVIGMGQMGGEGPSVFQTFMSTRGRRQQSNIVDHPTEEAPAVREDFRQIPFTDHMSDPEFHSYVRENASNTGLRFTPEQEARFGRLSQETPATPVRRPEPEPLAGRPVDHPDFTRLVDEHYNALREFSDNHHNEAWQPRGIHPGETLREFAEREVNRADPDLRYHGHREPAPEPDMYVQEPFVPHYPEVHEPGQSISSYGERRAAEKLRDYRSSDEPEIKSGSIGLKMDRDSGRRQELNFYHEPTNTIGSLDISQRNEGKQLYIHGIGLGENISPNSLGKRAMRDLIEALKEQYPNAETIKGFRVSGARSAVGQTGDAEMRIRPPKQSTQEDDIAAYLNNPLGATNAHRY